MKRTLILLILAGIFASCDSMKKSGADTDILTLTGQITELAMSSFQYGTHLIKSENKTYALKSSKVSLDAYTGQSVTLKGTKVAGYPIEGGPELIEVTEVSPESQKLSTRLGIASTEVTKDSVSLSFTVINNTEMTQRFCKWETPFEPRLGKYMEVTDGQGNEATFVGAMARRVMPPPAESYIAVPPHDSVRTVFNLAKNYVVKSGQYTVKYTGGGVSGLDAGNEIKIIIADL